MFIDIGSFTVADPAEPWTGYRQFCEMFLYPLFLQAYKDVPFHPWLRGSLEGVSARHCNSLMSARDRLRPGVFAHVYLLSKLQSRYEGTDRNVRQDLRAAGFGPELIKRNVTRMNEHRRATGPGAALTRHGRTTRTAIRTIRPIEIARSGSSSRRPRRDTGPWCGTSGVTRASTRGRSANAWITSSPSTPIIWRSSTSIAA